MQLGHTQVWFACGCMTGYIQVHVGVGNYSPFVIVLKGITWNCLSAWVQHFLCLYSLQALISGWAVSNGFPTCTPDSWSIADVPFDVLIWRSSWPLWYANQPLMIFKDYLQGYQPLSSISWEGVLDWGRAAWMVCTWFLVVIWKLYTSQIEGQSAVMHTYMHLWKWFWTVWDDWQSYQDAYIGVQVFCWYPVTGGCMMGQGANECWCYLDASRKSGWVEGLSVWIQSMQL